MNQTSADAQRNSSGITRRDFLERATVAGVGTAALPFIASGQIEARAASASNALKLFRPPDRITAYCGLEDPVPLSAAGDNWTGRSIEVTASPEESELPINVSSPRDAITHLHLRWNETVPSRLWCLGDAWERSYGDLAWRCLVPERPMPWYFATWDGAVTHGYGVKTGAKAFCFWQLDTEGASLWLDLSSGGVGVALVARRLLAATVVIREGQTGEEPIEAVRELCRRMCTRPRAPVGPIYGSNDWYYAYGKSSQEMILRDADLVASLRPANSAKPFTVIDEGWANKSKFPDMTRLAAEIRRRDVRPGIWERPLRAAAKTDPRLLLPAARFGERASRASELAFDPTIPEALQLVVEKISNIRLWGYELLKHDFTTYDLLGQWGFEMGASPTLPGWSFSDRSKTNAEIILDLYHAIRMAAGEETIILGCNTVGHLTAGIFDMDRTGDDTSGKVWERTRRMGINTLAFRLPQHQVFFTLDADCVAITDAMPWELTRQWLDVVARSGTALIISAAGAATGTEQKAAIKEAFATAASGRAAARPAGWLRETTPELWVDSKGRSEKRYQWCSPDGAYPFSV